MSEEQSWNLARLIPTSGINGADEQERRATSALLAVMSSVKEFGRALTAPLGAPAGKIETFIEVPFKLGEAKVFPDGLIRLTRGKSTWTALVEVKTGNNLLAVQQLENYLDVAREHGYQALITISNEIPPTEGQHPTAVDKRKLKRVSLHHWSWTKVLAEAVIQKEHRGVADPDQAWILGELIRYLEHPRSGALAFDDMGQNWVHVRDAVEANTLRAHDKAAAEVASRFDALVRYSCLKLGQRLGTEVVPFLTRAEQNDPLRRQSTLVTSLVDNGIMTAAIRVPNTVGPIELVADIRAGRVTCHIDVDAPREGRSTTRVNWLLRQLKDAPDSLRLEAFAIRARSGATDLLGAVRSDPAVLIDDPTKELKSFRVANSGPMGTKRGVGRGSFIDSVLECVQNTYELVGQNIKAWAPTPPRLRSSTEVEIEAGKPPAIPSAALSSQDGEASISAARELKSANGMP
ncbi:hypothetical protein [Leifsonia sp. Root112D2]|uniref:hypothetical protein n=1 Tax=Leifsonia sp. Root112D2 TaxID=1736426 RepID=UPI000B10CF7B|nr:hypothetical protein [Leifsonia sp. Root112D2]